MAESPGDAPGLDPATLYPALFGAYPDGLLLVDAGGVIRLANPAAAALLGYSTDELAGMQVDSLVPDAVRSRHAAYRAAYGQSPRSRPMGTQMELLARCRDGSEVMVEIALSPLQGTPAGLVVAAIRGISSYPRVQQALQRARYSECVAEFGRLAVDSRDTQSLLSEVPAAALRVLSADQAVLYRIEPDGQRVRTAACASTDNSGSGLTGVGQVHAVQAHTPWSLALAQGTPVLVEDYQQDSRFVQPDEFAATGLVSALVVTLADRGHIAGLLDVRSRRPQRFGADEVNFMQALANLLASVIQRADGEEALAHAARLESVGQLSGGIAHDFNNLLTVIQGNLQVLQELPAGQEEDTRDLVAAAMRASKRGAELTTKLLAFSRRQVLQPRCVDVQELLKALANMLRRTLDSRIRIAVQATNAGAVRADAAQLESALLNLAINARDAMPDGGLLAFDAQAEADFVAIAVSDNGSGMPAQVRDRAFEPFFTTKPKGRGTGLGLSTVYGFITQSAGTVQIDSEPGRGSTITLRLPRWQDNSDTTVREDADELAALPPGLRVLLVEDDVEVRKVVGSFLTSMACTFTAAANADEALALLDAGAEFRLLLSDVALGPGRRGTELARLAQQRRPRLAVLLMSGYASGLPDIERTQLPWALLRKPFSRDELLLALRRTLQAAR